MLLLLLMDLPFQILLLSPVILWYAAPPRWHPEVLAGGALLWGLLGWLVWGKLAQVRAAERATNLPQGDWRWRPGQSAEQFGAQCRLFLHNHGWRNARASSSAEGEVTVLAQKDRVHMLVHCLRGPAVADAAAIDAVAALREAQGCTAACLVTERPPEAALRTIALTRGVELMRFADIRFLDRFAG
jgi:hypothetical protein